MTIDEAIKHAEEVAEEKFNNAVSIMDKMKSDIALSNAEECKRCAEDHRQLAEWLKDYKRLKEQEPRWILDSERLPEESGNYLVTFRYGEKVETQEAVYFEDEDECKWFDLTDIEITLAVIAWMPLPEPYKSESEEKK